ncbi:hypothetical protein ACN47E_002157 [Coniothyrium glycines]
MVAKRKPWTGAEREALWTAINKYCHAHGVHTFPKAFDSNEAAAYINQVCAGSARSAAMVESQVKNAISGTRVEEETFPNKPIRDMFYAYKNIREDPDKYTDEQKHPKKAIPQAPDEIAEEAQQKASGVDIGNHEGRVEEMAVQTETPQDETFDRLDTSWLYEHQVEPSFFNDDGVWYFRNLNSNGSHEPF